MMQNSQWKFDQISLGKTINFISVLLHPRCMWTVENPNFYRSCRVQTLIFAYSSNCKCYNNMQNFEPKSTRLSLSFMSQNWTKFVQKSTKINISQDPFKNLPKCSQNPSKIDRKSNKNRLGNALAWHVVLEWEKWCPEWLLGRVGTYSRPRKSKRAGATGRTQP